MLSQITGLSGVYYQLNYTNDILDGHYKLITSKQTLFLKVTNINDSEAHIIAEKNKPFLYENNINTLQCIEGFPENQFRAWGVSVSLPLYRDPLCKTHNSPNGSGLGPNLANASSSYKKIPDKSDIKQNSNKHFELCLSGTDLLCHNLKSLNANTSAIKETIDHLMRKSFMRSPQVIHGDLNYGNVLSCDDDDGKIIFIDFEEASRSYFNPMIDVAMIIERFIIPSQNSPNKLLDEFRSSYTAITGQWFENSDQLAGLLRSLSARALLLLASEAVEEEWRNEERCKFLTLHQNAMDNFSQLSSWST